MKEKQTIWEGKRKKRLSLAVVFVEAFSPFQLSSEKLILKIKELRFVWQCVNDIPKLSR